MCSTSINTRMHTSDHRLWRPVEGLRIVVNDLKGIRNAWVKRLFVFNWRESTEIFVSHRQKPKEQRSGVREGCVFAHTHILTRTVFLVLVWETHFCCLPKPSTCVALYTIRVNESRSAVATNYTSNYSWTSSSVYIHENGDSDQANGKSCSPEAIWRVGFLVLWRIAWMLLCFSRCTLTLQSTTGTMKHYYAVRKLALSCARYRPKQEIQTNNKGMYEFMNPVPTSQCTPCALRSEGQLITVAHGNNHRLLHGT
jgi:hypothetical protein